MTDVSPAVPPLVTSLSGPNMVCSCVLCVERAHEAERNRDAARRLTELAAAPPVVTYVQHVSGQGKKWKVLTELTPTRRSVAGAHHFWAVEPDAVPEAGELEYLFLPKSEFFLCEPPVVWTDVTVSCSIEDGALVHRPGIGAATVALFVHDVHPRIVLRHDYRFRLVAGPGATADAPQRWAFVVEYREL